MNLKLITSLVSVAGLISSAAADQAPKVKSNPKNVVAIAEFPSGFDKKVMGNIIFSAKKGKVVQVHVDMTGLPPAGGPFQYHIHDHPVPADGNCEKVGLHFNPYNAPSDCNAQKDDSYCQVGDLSGKHGWIDTTCFETRYDDPFISLNKKSKSYIVGKSITFHFANLDKFACANIEIATKERLKQLKEEFKKAQADDNAESVDQNIDDYSAYFADDSFVDYNFNEDEALESESFELATENNEPDYDYDSMAKSPRNFKLIGVFDNKTKYGNGTHKTGGKLNSSSLTTGHHQGENWTNATSGQVQHYESASSENKAGGSFMFSSDGFTAALGVIVGLLI